MTPPPAQTSRSRKRKSPLRRRPSRRRRSRESRPARALRARPVLLAPRARPTPRSYRSARRRSAGPARAAWRRSGRRTSTASRRSSRCWRSGSDERCAAQWYRVQLPLKPNGSTGWVRAADVELEPVTTRIEVDLSERRVTLFDGGRRVLTATAAIGSPQTPTPTGRYYVNQRLVPTDASGPFGPGAIGISAFSEVLHRLDAGGPDRDPRDEPARPARPCRLERLHPRPQRSAPAVLRPDAGGYSGYRSELTG